MFALFVISGIATLICSCIGVFDITAWVRSGPNFAVCKNRLLRGTALIIVPTAIMMLSMAAMFGW